MKRSPIKRRTPIKRKRARRIDRKGDGERRFTTWIHDNQRCVGHGLIASHVCSGRLEQAHARNMTGLGLKESDLNSVPMCSALHAAFDGHTAWFRGWSKEERRVWFMARVAECQARYEIETGRRIVLEMAA